MSDKPPVDPAELRRKLEQAINGLRSRTEAADRCYSACVSAGVDVPAEAKKELAKHKRLVEQLAGGGT